ncbi:hypothetical protein HK098_004972 [Nowakowskiella sp. JEL0407]|nr:hypothetical protein HK098_004972 [Nowakowskiella sp. JEL0407]
MICKLVTLLYILHLCNAFPVDSSRSFFELTESEISALANVVLPVAYFGGAPKRKLHKRASSTDINLQQKPTGLPTPSPVETDSSLIDQEIPTEFLPFEPDYSAGFNSNSPVERYYPDLPEISEPPSEDDCLTLHQKWVQSLKCEGFQEYVNTLKQGSNFFVPRINTFDFDQQCPLPGKKMDTCDNLPPDYALGSDIWISCLQRFRVSKPPSVNLLAYSSAPIFGLWRDFCEYEAPNKTVGNVAIILIQHFFSNPLAYRPPTQLTTEELCMHTQGDGYGNNEISIINPLLNRALSEWFIQLYSWLIVKKFTPQQLRQFVVFAGHVDRALKRFCGDHRFEMPYMMSPPDNSNNDWRSQFTPSGTPTPTFTTTGTQTGTIIRELILTPRTMATKFSLELKGDEVEAISRVMFVAGQHSPFGNVVGLSKRMFQRRDASPTETNFNEIPPTGTPPFLATVSYMKDPNESRASSTGELLPPIDSYPPHETPLAYVGDSSPPSNLNYENLPLFWPGPTYSEKSCLEFHHKWIESLTCPGFQAFVSEIRKKSYFFVPSSESFSFSGQCPKIDEPYDSCNNLPPRLQLGSEVWQGCVALFKGRNLGVDLRQYSLAPQYAVWSAFCERPTGDAVGDLMARVIGYFFTNPGATEPDDYMFTPNELCAQSEYEYGALEPKPELYTAFDDWFMQVYGWLVIKNFPEQKLALFTEFANRIGRGVKKFCHDAGSPETASPTPAITLTTNFEPTASTSPLRTETTTTSRTTTTIVESPTPQTETNTSKGMEETATTETQSTSELMEDTTSSTYFEEQTSGTTTIPPESETTSEPAPTESESGAETATEESDTSVETTSAESQSASESATEESNTSLETTPTESESASATEEITSTETTPTESGSASETTTEDHNTSAETTQRESDSTSETVTEEITSLESTPTESESVSEVETLTETETTAKDSETTSDVEAETTAPTETRLTEFASRSEESTNAETSSESVETSVSISEEPSVTDTETTSDFTEEITSTIETSTI